MNQNKQNIKIRKIKKEGMNQNKQNIKIKNK